MKAKRLSHDRPAPWTAGIAWADLAVAGLFIAVSAPAGQDRPYGCTKRQACAQARRLHERKANRDDHDHVEHAHEHAHSNETHEHNHVHETGLEGVHEHSS
ncbi:MAG: hypothetical protein M3256_26970 [Actinomycetota bacterium]|nr:hypothetical protein [Actinomycetota bacterium]